MKNDWLHKASMTPDETLKEMRKNELRKQKVGCLMVFALIFVLCFGCLTYGKHRGVKHAQEMAELIGVGNYLDNGDFSWNTEDGSLRCFWDYYYVFKKRLFCIDQEGVPYQYGKLPARQKWSLD